MWRGGRRDLKENRLTWEGNEFHLSSSFAFVSLNYYFFLNKFLSGPTLDYEEGKQKLFSAKVKSFLGAVRYDASLFHTFFFFYFLTFLSFSPTNSSPIVIRPHVDTSHPVAYLLNGSFLFFFSSAQNTHFLSFVIVPFFFFL